MSVHLKIEDSHEGLVATISQRDGVGKVVRRPLRCFFIESKRGSKKRRRRLRGHSA